MKCALGPFAHLTVSWTTIRKALRARGYNRRRALRKPPCSEKTKQRRLAWALEHVNWTPVQWCSLLWTDETWMTYGHHRAVYVTRKANEAWDETTTRDRVQRKPGWMFWGSFANGQKGPCLFWEKEWGSINASSYQISCLLTYLRGTTWLISI